MARQPRLDLPGFPQHVIVRGVNRDPIFHGVRDYRYFLKILFEACRKHSCDLHAYVLMTNHVHLLVTPRSSRDIGKSVQMIGRHYVRYFNLSNCRTGALWESRYKSTTVDSENYLLTCYRYIELNPVRAAIVAHPAHYPWSSYSVNALGAYNAGISPHDIYLALGHNPESRRQAYCDLFEIEIDEKTLQSIREATNKSWPLGSEVFKDQIQSVANRRVRERPRGGDRKSLKYRHPKINGV